MSDAGDRPRAAPIAHLLGWATAAVGVSVLVGWALDVPGLKTVIPGTVSMKTNTAVAFVLAGLSLTVVPGGPRARLLVQVLAGATALLGLATLAQYLLAVDLGIDQLLFREADGAVGTLAPNRMAPTTAIAFALVGAARWLVASPRTIAAGQRIALVVGFLGFLSVTAYFCGATDLLGVGRYTQMAANTAVLFVLLCAGLLLLRPGEGILANVAVRPVQVLDHDGSNVKALYRRAQAHLALQDVVEAEADIKAALAAEPGTYQNPNKTLRDPTKNPKPTPPVQAKEKVAEPFPKPYPNPGIHASGWSSQRKS